MKTQTKAFIALTLFLVAGLFICINLASAMIINNVEQGKIYPGESGSVSVEVKNTFGEDIEDVSLVLDFSMLPFSTVGSAEQSADGIDEDDTETFDFTLKAGNDAKPGDYNIPYIITYANPDAIEITVNGSTTLMNPVIVKKGTIGVSIGAKTEIDYSIETQNPVIGQKGKVTLKMINRGFGDIKFVSVKASPSGFTLISDDENYIGTVNSNDFETASYDVVFNNENAKITATVKYKDFDNKDIVQNVELPVKVYTPQEAIELGIIQKSNSMVYVGIIITLILLYVIYRTIKKRNKKKRQNGGN